MRTRAPWLLPLLIACGSPAPETDSDTEVDTQVEDTEPVDTEPQEIDARGWEIDPDAEQLFTGTLVIGDNELELDFTGRNTHVVRKVGEVDFRNFVGIIERENPFAENPPMISLRARVITREDQADPATVSCKGAGPFGVNLEIYALAEVVPNKVFTSARLEPDGDEDCEIDIRRITKRRFVAVIDDAPMLDANDVTVRLKDVAIDLNLRLAPPDTDTPADTDGG